MADALTQYRGQNGIAQAGSYDPQVIAWIRQAAREAGADERALLATALMESGAQRGREGDNGTSFGPFQHHIGGALGTHPPAWANTYAAVRERAQQFARLQVHGGAGAAAIQRPASPGIYAQGVNDLLARANAILGRTPMGGPTPLSHPHTAPGRVLDYDPQGAFDFINALLGDTSVDQLARLGQRLLPSAAQRSPGGTAASPPSAAGAPTLTPGDGWGGSQGLARTLAQIGQRNGLKIASEKRTRKLTASGGTSDHWTGSTNAYAYDLSNGSAPTPQMDKTAAEIAADLGVPNWTGGVLNVRRGGYRYQLLYRTNVGGNHFNHVHIGVRKI